MDTRGPEFASWYKDTLGVDLREWQTQVADRLLEIDLDGRWCWGSGFVVLTPRQVGKSTLLRGLGGWFASQGRLVLATTNRLRTAAEVLRPLGVYVDEHRDQGGRWFHSFDQPQVTWPGSRGRFVWQACNDSLGVGWSPEIGLVDEGWDVRQDAVLQGMVPAMSGADNPLLALFSTVGNAQSVLLNRYREAALAGQGVGLAEWAAPPEADWLDEEAWRQASPEWTPRRLRFLRQQSAVMAEPKFRSQFLGQSVHAADAWIAPALWGKAAGTVGELTGGVVAVEITLDGSRHYTCHARRDEQGVVEVALESCESFRAVDEHLRRARPQTVLAPAVYRERIARVDREVNAAGISQAMPVVMSLLKAKRLRHGGDDRLTEQVLAAVAKVTKAGQQTLISADGRSLSAVRAMLWAAAEASEAKAGRPRLRVAR